MPRSYTVITPNSRIPVVTCSQLLPNQMQCWKPGAILVKEPSPKEGQPDREYQLCRNHAAIQQQADQLAAQQEKPAEEVHNEMLQANMIQTQTAPPKGEDSTNNTVITKGPVTQK